MTIMQQARKRAVLAQGGIAIHQGHGMDLFHTSDQRRQRHPSSIGGDVPYSGTQHAGRGALPGAARALSKCSGVFTTRQRGTGPAEKGRITLRRRSTFS